MRFLSLFNRKDVEDELNEVRDLVATNRRQIEDLSLALSSLKRQMGDVEDYVARLAGRVLKRVERAEKAPESSQTAEEAGGGGPTMDEWTKRALEARRRASGIPNDSSTIRGKGSQQG